MVICSGTISLFMDVSKTYLHFLDPCLYDAGLFLYPKTFRDFTMPSDIIGRVGIQRIVVPLLSIGEIMSDLISKLKEAGISEDLLKEVEGSVVPSAQNTEEFTKYLNGLEDSNILKRSVDSIISKKQANIEKSLMEEKFPAAVNEAVSRALLEQESQKSKQAAETLLANEKDPIKREVLELRAKTLEQEKSLAQVQEQFRLQERQTKVTSAFDGLDINNKSELAGQLAGVTGGDEIATGIATAFKSLQEENAKLRKTDTVSSGQKIPDGDNGGAVDSVSDMAQAMQFPKQG